MAGLLTPPVWGGVLLVFLLALVVLSVMCYRKAEVRI